MATNQTDRDYLLRRELQERAAAHASAEPCARDAHLELADRYAAMLGELNEAV